MTPPFNPCIITGAQLFLQCRGVYVRGDLFLQGNQFVFNACLDLEDMEPAWEDSYTASKDPSRNVTLNVGCHYFERRAVFVIPLESLSLDEEVFNYFKKGLEGTNYSYSPRHMKLILEN